MYRSWFTRIVGASVAASIGSGASVGLAAVNDVTGDVVLMAPPASVVPDAAFSDTSVIHGFVERRRLVSRTLIAVDHAPNAPEGAFLTIPAETCMTVYMLHFDATAPSSARGRLELTTPILGVISTQLLLDQTNDALGNTPEAGDAGDAGALPTVYPGTADCQVAAPGSGDCGLERNDVIELQPQSIEVELHANGPGDRVRVIAQCDP
jgi:hypothetical protein